MDIHEFKREYYEKCTIGGLMGKGVEWLARLSPVVAFLYLILSLVISLGSEHQTIKMVIVLVIYSGYIFLLISMSKRQIEKISGAKPDNFRSLSNSAMKNLIKRNFEDLLLSYNLKKNGDLGNDAKCNEKLDYIVKSLYMHSEKTKYTFVTEGAILGAMLLPIWLKIIDHIIIEEMFKFIIHMGGILSVLIIAYISLKGIVFLSSEIIINNESKNYYNFANRLDAYRNLEI